MEQLQQEQQFKQVASNLRVGVRQKKSINIHNPNTSEQTAKYLAGLILRSLEKDWGDSL